MCRLVDEEHWNRKDGEHLNLLAGSFLCATSFCHTSLRLVFTSFQLFLHLFGFLRNIRSVMNFQRVGWNRV